MEKTMKARVQHKHDLESNWLKATNFTPLVGEIIVYDPDESYGYPRIKIGDGETNINNLPFITEDYAKIADIPTKPADIGAQPAGNYLTSIPSEYVTESELNAKGYLTGYTESDPTVPAWAKAAVKPTYTASEVGALPNTTKIPDALSELSEDASHRVVTDAEKSAWNAKAEVSTIPTKVSQLTNDSNYLTEHQDISGKLDANKLPEAINTALAQAKDSGEFDGKNGYNPVRGIDYWTSSDIAEIKSYVDDVILGGEW